MAKKERILYHFKLLLILIRVYWQRHIIYRLSAIIWIINGMIIPFVLMGVWLTIQEHNQLPMDDKQIITYYILSILVVRLTQSWRAEGLGELIKDGGFSIYLLRPFSFFIQELARDLSMKMIRIISLMPFLLLIAFLFKEKMIFSYSLLNIILFAAAVILGFLINFLLEMTIGLLSFWLEHTSGAAMTIGIVNGLFNGSLIPLALMPQFLGELMIFLPFRYIVSFPIELLMNSLDGIQILQGFLILIVWMVLMKLLLSFTYSKGVGKYSAVGI